MSRVHIQSGVRPAHALVAHNRQRDGGDSGPGERGQASRKVVRGQCRALLAARVQGHDGGQRRERAGANADDHRGHDHHEGVRTEPLRNVVEGRRAGGEHRAAEPSHGPHPAEPIHEPTPEGVEDQDDDEYEAPDTHPFLGFEDVDAAIVSGAQVKRHDDRGTRRAADC